MSSIGEKREREDDTSLLEDKHIDKKPETVKENNEKIEKVVKKVEEKVEEKIEEKVETKENGDIKENKETAQKRKLETEDEEKDDKKDNENENEKSELKNKETNDNDDDKEKKKEEKEEKKDDKVEAPAPKKQKVDENDKKESSPAKKVFGTSTSQTLSFSSFSNPSQKIGFGSAFTSFKSSFGTSSGSFDSLLKSEGKENDKKDEKEKESQFHEKDIKTGEEDEICIHSTRARLYEDENNVWKERGIGTLKININKNDSAKARIIMRTEGILRVILNVRLLPGMKSSIVQDKYISFAAISESKSFKRYLVKTGSTMGANELQQAIMKAIPK